MLVDDHTMVRQGLARSLGERGIEIIGEARDGDEAVPLAGTLKPDVILMDVTMPHLDGVDATRQIHTSWPEIRIVMLTMHADHDVMVAAIRAGAVGYLVKDCSTDEIVDALTMAVSGDPVVSPQLAASMLSEVHRDIERSGRAHDEHVVSRREEEVLQLIVDGHSTTEVGEKLFISPKTVKNHLASIYMKLDARDRTQAVLQAVRMGIVHIN